MSASLAKDKRQKKSKIVLPPKKSIYRLYRCEELSQRLIVLSKCGEVSLHDSESLDFITPKTHSSPRSSNVLRSFFFPSSSASFVPTTAAAALVEIVSEETPPSSLRLKVITIDTQDIIAQVGDYSLPFKQNEIASSSCSASGCISVLCTDGTWHSYQLSTSPPSDDQQLSQLSPPFQLTGLSFISSPTLKQSISLLALTSSHVLLSGVSPTSPSEIILLLWDLQYSILLTSQTLPIPSVLAPNPLQLRLVPASTISSKEAQNQTLQDQALLLLSPSGKTADKMQSTSSVIVVSYAIPHTSTIAAAMGKAASSKQWIRNTPTTQTQPADVARTKLLETMRTAMEAGRAQAAAAAFFAWEKSEKEADTKKNTTNGATKPSLSFTFVRDVLNTVLSTSIKSNKAHLSPSSYSPEVLKYLLERRVVSSGMVDGGNGLLTALRARNDWVSIRLAFTTVLDLPESEIVECLRVVAVYHREQHSADAMEVDSHPATSIPSLPSFLSLCTTYPTSQKYLLLALRQHLREIEDIMCVAQVLDDWVSKWGARRAAGEERLLPSKKDIRKNEHGMWVVVGRKDAGKKQDELLPLEKVVAFLQTLMDASFLSLLQHPPAHQILKHLRAQLEPEVVFAEMVEQLRGPLEPFAVGHEKALKEAAIPEKERKKEREKGDWRQRKNDKAMRTDIGVYQLEELVL